MLKNIVVAVLIFLVLVMSIYATVQNTEARRQEVLAKQAFRELKECHASQGRK